MKKSELMALLKEIDGDPEIGFQCDDLGVDCPAEWISRMRELDDDHFAKINQGIDFILT